MRNFCLALLVCCKTFRRFWSAAALQIFVLLTHYCYWETAFFAVLKLSKIRLSFSAVFSGGAGGARAPPEFGGSQKGRSLISAYQSLAITTNTPGFEKLNTALKAVTFLKRIKMAILFLDFFGSEPSKMDQTCKFSEQTSRILEFKHEGLDF